MMNVLKFEKPRVTHSQIESVLQYKKICAEIKKLESFKRELKSYIITQLKDSTSVYDTQGTEIARLIEKNRQTVDSAKLKKEYSDIYSDCIKITTYQELKVY